MNSNAASAEQGGIGRTHVAIAVSFLAGGLAIGYLFGRRFGLTSSLTQKAVSKVNIGCLKPECDKVVDTVEMEDIGQQKVFCRCWQSKKFPYCDGSHNVHNKKTGDNVGPIIVKGQPPEKTAA